MIHTKMIQMPKILHAKTEPELAAYQTRQIGNSCSFHAIATSLHLLLGYHIDPAELEEEINQLWWRGRFMRVAPDWAVTPRMQVRIVRYLAKKHHLPITAQYYRGNPEMLLTALSDSLCECVPLITLIWLWRKAPPIYLADTTRNFNQVRSAGGHTMLLAAYDPDHWAEGQFPTPWGFINPWITHSEHLFWMRDEDFLKAWGFWLPFNGPNPLVLIRRTALPQ